MSKREMICSLVSNNVEQRDLELLYNLVLRFIPTDTAMPDELECIAETENETEFVPFGQVNWD